MPACYCQFSHCGGANVSVAAFNRHQRQDRIAMFQAAADATQQTCKRQDDAMRVYLTSGQGQDDPLTDGGPSTPRIRTYQHLIHSHLRELGVIEKKVDNLITSTELGLLNLGLPRSCEEDFPLCSSMNSVREILHELSSIHNRSPSVQETKSSISDRLSSLMPKLKAAKKHWKRVQEKIPRVHPSSSPEPVYETSKQSASILPMLDPIIQATVFTMVVLQVVLHLSRRGCCFVLAMIRFIVQLALLRQGSTLSVPDQKLLADFPSDPDTVVKQFLLDGDETIYAVCPKASCQKLHAPKFSGVSPIPQYPLYCSNCEFPGGRQCGIRLTRPRYFGDAEIEIPIKRFVSFSFKSYVASLTSCAGFEDYMDHVSAPGGEKETLIRDAFDGEFLRTFKGSDGKPFRATSGPEGRYAFSLGFDFFNPLSNKQSGKKISFGIISVVCLNLPIHLRYNPENMFLAGIIPGPNEPPLTASNHYLSPIIDEFLEFWKPGVRFSQTSKYPAGRLIFCALILVVCDLLAARKISGFASCTSEHFCNVCHCTLSHPGLKDTNYSQWTTRTDKEYRQAMDEYQAAHTVEDREDKFKKLGVRWSELQRLGYFNMVDCIVVDPAHNHFLGLINEHFTNILGIRIKSFQEDPVIRVVFHDIASLNLPENTIKWIDSIRNWLQSPFGITFGPSRERGIKKLMRANAEALRVVCTQIGCPLPVLPEGHRNYVKQNYCEAILDWVRITQISYQSIAFLTKKFKRGAQNEIRDTAVMTSTLCGHVLQPEEMAEIWSDLSKTLTPSWMTSVPARLGQPSHGKLKADQWRALGTTHLAMSLIRLWAMSSEDTERSRKCYDILGVTLSLISATILATSHTITAANADAYLTHMLSYLQGIQRLFPGYKLKPNHHMALHIHRYLSLFGPVHSWWALPFERLVGRLQRIPNNGKIGEMEETLSRAYARMSNLQTLLSKHGCPEVIQHSRPFFERLFCSQSRDRIQMAIQPHQDAMRHEADRATDRVLPSDLRLAFLSTALIQTPVRGHLLSQFLINGLTFATSAKHSGNSCVMITASDAQEPVPAQLVYIVRFASHGPSPYLAVRRHRVANITRDPYLCFPVLQAQLWDAHLDELEIITTSQVSCHFACLPLQFEGQELIAALPLSRTIILHTADDAQED